jgi:hypothetical protein
MWWGSFSAVSRLVGAASAKTATGRRDRSMHRVRRMVVNFFMMISFLKIEFPEFLLVFIVQFSYVFFNRKNTLNRRKTVIIFKTEEIFRISLAMRF